MISVTCRWKDGQWALILGLVRDELDGIWSGRSLACPMRNLPKVIAAPVLFVLMRHEDYHDTMSYEAIVEKLYEHYPDEDTIVPVLLHEDARMALEDGKHIQFPSEKAFGSVAPTGWKNCRFVEVRFRDTEEQLIACLEGRNKVDLRGATDQQ